jgi:hypothetical protein
MTAARPLSAMLAITLALFCATPVSAAPGFFERLLGGRLGSVQGGTYLAGDKIHFQLERFGHDFLIRFDNNPETFVLYADRTSMGGRVLKYDSGETAIRVAGWGALTLYTDAQPNGLPAMRSGDAPSLSPAPVSVQNVQFLAAQEAARLNHVRHLHIAFVVDWSVLETDNALCAAASNALENAARGIERYVHDGQNRKELLAHVRTVTLATARRPTLTLQDKTLIVTFNPERLYSGSASSRAIARALPIVFAKKHQRTAKD